MILMPKRLYEEQDIANIADAVRSFADTEKKMKVSDLAGEINSEVQAIEDVFAKIMTKYEITEEDLRKKEE